MTVDGPIPRPRSLRDNPQPSELLTVDDAASRLGVPVRFIRWLIAERRIRFYKIGRYVRIDDGDLDAFIEAGRVDPERRPRPSPQVCSSATPESLERVECLGSRQQEPVGFRPAAAQPHLTERRS
jgi:excisionase family DNA binding protein